MFNLDESLFTSASSDKTIKIWDSKKSYQCIKTINENEAPIKLFCLLHYGKIAVGDDFGIINVFNPAEVTNV